MRAILTIAQVADAGSHISELDSNRGRGLCLTILKDFAHLLLAALVADRSIPDPVLHKLWDGV